MVFIYMKITLNLSRYIDDVLEACHANLTIQDLKLKEIIHYLSYLSGGNPRKLGKVRLNKILWFFEGIMYIKTGKKPIGIKFIKKKYGTCFA
jgi:hypothetical protein